MTINRPQMVIMWIAGSLVSAALAYFDVVRPNIIIHQNKSQQMSLQMEYWDRYPTPRPRYNASSEENAIREQKQKEIWTEGYLPRWERCQKEIDAAHINYAGGIVIPIAIMSICAFITVGRKRDKVIANGQQGGESAGEQGKDLHPNIGTVIFRNDKKY